MIRGGLISPQLQRLGKISIGEKGEVRTSTKGTNFQEPKKLSYFTIRTAYRTEKGQLAVDEAVMKRLGSEPKELKIRLPFNDLERNFETELRYYKGGMKFCSGDGEQGFRRDERLVNGKPVYGEVKPWPGCGRMCPDFQRGNCKRYGALRVILEEQQQVGGVYEYRTTSRHSIENILSGLMTIQLQSNGVLAWLPLTMRLVPQTVTTPTGQAVRAYIVQIVFAGSPQDLLETVKEILALRAPLLAEIKALEAGMPPTIDDPLESQDTQDEFYPEQSKAELQDRMPPPADDSGAAPQEILRAIQATLQLHRPYTGPREGAYVTFMPLEAMEIVRAVFHVERYKDLKTQTIDALQVGYEALLAVLEPEDLADEAESVEAVLVDDEPDESLDDGLVTDQTDMPADSPGEPVGESSVAEVQEDAPTPEVSTTDTPDASIIELRDAYTSAIEMAVASAYDRSPLAAASISEATRPLPDEIQDQPVVQDVRLPKASRLHPPPTAFQWNQVATSARRLGLDADDIDTMLQGSYDAALAKLEQLDATTRGREDEDAPTV